MAYPDHIKLAVRRAYIHDRMTLGQIEASYDITASTVTRWKQSAKKDGDDWEKLRTAAMFAGDGLESITRQTLGEYLLQHSALMEKINADSDTPAAKKVTLLASLADSFNKTVTASKRALPETNELAVALETINLLAGYVQNHFPQHLPAFLEILEPFGLELSKIFAQKS